MSPHSRLAPPVDLAHRTIVAYHALGNEIVDRGAMRVVRCRATPQVWTANFACRVRAATPDAIAAVLDELDRDLSHCDHRRVLMDPETPAAFEAALVVRDFVCDGEVQMLLTGALRAPSSNRHEDVAIRPATSDADWESIGRLARLDHEGEARRGGYEVFPLEVSRQIVDRWRAKGPAMRFWLAASNGCDVGYFGSWPGIQGMGLVDDLFTHPDFRRRGIATALIARAVDDARDRGAGAVLIGARIDDTPKALYSALGFEPLCVARNYLKHP